jgi:hypothetical protein
MDEGNHEQPKPRRRTTDFEVFRAIISHASTIMDRAEGLVEEAPQKQDQPEPEPLPEGEARRGTISDSSDTP